jgi:hypothetical protein
MLNWQKMCAATAMTTTLLVGGAGVGGCGGSERVEVGKPSISSKDLDVQDFSAAAEQATQQMLAAPRVKQELERVARTLPPGQLPLIKISRIKDDSGIRGVNMVDYFASPIESVLVNSGKADTISEDKQAQAMRNGTELLEGRQPRISNLVLNGFVSKLRTRGNNDVEQNAYTFQVRLVDAAGNNIFIGNPERIVKRISH